MYPKALVPRLVAGVLLACFLILFCAGCRRQDAAPGAAHTPETADAAGAYASETADGAGMKAAETKAGAPAAAAPASPDGPTEEGTARGEQSIEYARGYVRVVSPTQEGWLPLPEEEDYVYPLRQAGGDGREIVNVIHVTPTGVCMESANCENRDCVLQGEVTLGNKGTRLLGNMIICLPHQVVLELYSTEELLALSPEQEGVSQ